MQHEIQVGDTWNANVWDLGNPMADQNSVAIQGHGAFAGNPYATATYADPSKGHLYTVQEVYSAVAYLAIFSSPTAARMLTESSMQSGL